jgi:hypothetical protein
MKHNNIFFFSVLLIVSLCLFHEIPAQEKSGMTDSIQQNKLTKKRTIEDLHHEWDSANVAESRLPSYLRKMGNLLRDHIKKMKDAGVTSANARSKVVQRNFSSGVFHVDSLARIQMVLHFKDLDIAMLDKLQKMGIKISLMGCRSSSRQEELLSYLREEHIGVVSIDQSSPDELDCWVPFDRVEEVAKLPSLLSMNAYSIVIHDVGSVTSKGDTVLNSYLARSLFYVNGTGSKIGIISDGVDHWADLAPPNDTELPILEVYGAGSGDEGTAMSEIVHDIAPGAAIAFSGAGANVTEAKNAMAVLEGAGCNVIVDDIFLPYDEAAFEDNLLALKLDTIVHDGIIYISSCGNSGKTVYDNIYNPDGYGYHQFIYGDDQDSLHVSDGRRVLAVLQWSEKWGLSNENYALGAYYDNYVSVPGTNNCQGCGDTIPREFIDWTNSTGMEKVLHFQIAKLSGSGDDRELKLWISTVDDTSKTLQWRSDNGIYGHKAADSCISVAAINANNSNFPRTVAGYSSRGNSFIYSYDGNGDPIASTIRYTPTVSGVDGIQTKSGQLGNIPNPYYGTSAAAAHIAGVAALMRSVNARLTPSQIRNIMNNSAVTVSGWGGSGLVDAYQAVLNSVRKVIDTTFNTSATINNYTQFYGNTTVNNNVTITIPQNNTVIFTGFIYMGTTNAKVTGKGTMILRDVQPYQGEIVSERYYGRIILDHDPKLGSPGNIPKIVPSVPLDVTSLNSRLSIYGSLILNENVYDTLANSMIVKVDSGGQFNLMSNSKFVVSNTCSLQIKGGGIVQIPSGAQLSCSGTTIVDQGGTIEVGTGGILRIETGGLMQLLAGGNGSVVVDSGGQVICYGTITASDTLYAKSHGTIQIQSGGQLTLNSGGAVVLDVSAQFTNSGTTTINSGSILDTRQLSNVSTQSGGTTKINHGANLNIWGDGSSNNASLDCSGTLSNNGTIQCDGSFTIHTGGKLQVDSLASMKFGHGSTLSSSGTIIAKGTSTNRILFTSDNASPAAGDWNGIVCSGGGPDTLIFCRVNYASTGITLTNTSGLSYIRNDTITQCSNFGVDVSNNNTVNVALRIYKCGINNTINYGLRVTNAKLLMSYTRIENDTGIIATTGAIVFIDSSRVDAGPGYGIKSSGSGTVVTLSPDGLLPGNNTINQHTWDEIYATTSSSVFLGIMVRYTECSCGIQRPIKIGRGVSQINNCPPGCTMTVSYALHGGYNNVYNTNTDSCRLVNNTTASSIAAQYTYWGWQTSGPRFCGPVDATSPLEDTISTPAKTVATGFHGYSSGDQSWWTPDNPFVNWLISLAVDVQGDSTDALDALRQLSIFVGPGGNYQAVLGEPWMSFVTDLEDSSSSQPVKNLARVLELQALLDAKDYTKVMTRADAILQVNPSDDAWIFCQAAKEIASIGLGNIADAEAIFDGASQRGYLIDVNVVRAMENYIILAATTSSDTTTGLNKESSASIRSWHSHLYGSKTVVKKPSQYSLEQNYPNPFNPTTTIRYMLPTSSQVSIRVFNILGQEVKSLVDGYENAGYKSVQFDGSHLPSGIYFYRIQTGKFSDVKKFVLLR